MATTVQPLFGVATVRKNDCEKILTCLKNLSIGYLQSITPLIQTMRTLADSSTRRRTSYGRQKSVNKEPRTIRGIWSFAPVELLNQSRRTCLVRIYVNAKALRYKPRRTVSRIIQDKLNALARFHSLLKANGRISIRLKTYSIEALQTPTSLMLISAVGAVIASHSRPISFSSLSATGPAQSYGLQDPQDPEKADTPHEHHPDAYYKSPGKWWCGYQGEDTVVLDDYRADWCTYGVLLRWADRYPCLIETKGGTIPLLCKLIIITTCKTPQETFPNKYDRQLERRISEVIIKKMPLSE